MAVASAKHQYLVVVVAGGQRAGRDAAITAVAGHPLLDLPQFLATEVLRATIQTEIGRPPGRRGKRQGRGPGNGG